MQQRLVTVEGVVDSSDIAAGEQRTVVWTDRLRTMTNAGLVRVLEWHHDEPAPEPKKTPAKRRRRAPDAEE